MIKFNFTVTDEEAETIFDIIHNEISRCHYRKMLSTTTKEESQWFDKHIEYLTSLKKKMVNERV